MKLKSPEEAFRFVMSEIWSEYSHLSDPLQAEIWIAIGPPVGAFVVTLRWGDVTDRKTHQRGFFLTELCDKNFSMTSWLRAFIAESGIYDDCPVRRGMREQIQGANSNEKEA